MVRFLSFAVAGRRLGCVRHVRRTRVSGTLPIQSARGHQSMQQPFRSFLQPGRHVPRCDSTTVGCSSVRVTPASSVPLVVVMGRNWPHSRLTQRRRQGRVGVEANRVGCLYRSFPARSPVNLNRRVWFFVKNVSCMSSQPKRLAHWPCVTYPQTC